MAVIPQNDTPLVLLQCGVEPVTRDEGAPATLLRNAVALAAWVRLIRQAAGGPVLVVAPALALTGHRRKDHGVSLAAVSAPPEVAFAPVLEALAETGCWLVTTGQEELPQFPGRYLHSAFVLSPAGLAMRHPKVQDWGAPGMLAIREDHDGFVAAMGPDAVFPVVETPFGVIGCLVGSESLVPEAARRLVDGGATLLVQPASGATDLDRNLPFGLMQQALAYACGTPLASAAGAGERLDGRLVTERYGAGSRLVDAGGRVAGALDGQGEGFLLVTIPAGSTSQARAAQRRDTEPAWELYRDLYGRQRP